MVETAMVVAARASVEVAMAVLSMAMVETTMVAEAAKVVIKMVIGWHEKWNFSPEDTRSVASSGGSKVD